MFSASLAAAQTVALYPVPDPFHVPVGYAIGSDGNLWTAIGGNNGNAIGMVTSDGTLIEYPIPYAGGLPSDITAGPDGALWFTEANAADQSQVIGMMTTSGTFALYTVPTVDSGAGGWITAGPDGNLWFTEVEARKIGMVTTGGVFTEYPVPFGNRATYLTAGPDGNVWFTEDQANQIGMVTPTGTFTEYAIPTAGSNPGAITAGPDGALWFTERGSSGKIGRVTTSGTFTEYPIPNSLYYPTGIAVGPEGALWFTEWTAAAGVTDVKIASVTTSGVFTEYHLADPSLGVTLSIAVGPDGNLWSQLWGFASDWIVRFKRPNLCGDTFVDIGVEQCDDGNLANGDGCDSSCLLESDTVSVTSATGVFVATTDGEVDGATPSDPVETTVTSPNPGTISIVESAASPPLASGLVPLTGSVAITAPTATATNPLQFEFVLDRSILPATGSVVWLRNDVAVPRCTGPSGQASPDPCMAPPTTIGTDVHFMIYSSAASIWRPVVVLCDGSTATKPKLTAANIIPPSGDDRLLIKGEAVVPSSPRLDPLSSGVRILLAGATGASLLDVTVPSGAYDAISKTGWKRNAAQSVWTYKGPGTATAGIRKVRVKTDPQIQGGIKFRITGKSGSYPLTASDVPVAATLILDVASPTTEQCVEVRFPATPPTSPSCTLVDDTTLKCK
jgi:virginiamycin B lyase